MTPSDQSIALPRDTTTAMNPHVFFRVLRRTLLYIALSIAAGLVADEHDRAAGWLDR